MASSPPQKGSEFWLDVWFYSRLENEALEA